MGSICAYDSPNKCINGITINKLGMEELLARRYEKLCPIRGVTADFAREVLGKEGQGNSLSFSEAKRALGAVGFQKQLLDNPDSSDFVFVSSFEVDQVFPKEDLLAACVLLSNSGPLEKLKVFFNMYDREGKRMINHEELSSMFEAIFRVSTFNSLYLAFGNDRVHLSDTQITAYSDKLSRHQERFVSELAVVILLGQPEIGEEKFSQVLGRGNYAEIFTPSGLREYLLSFHDSCSTSQSDL